MQSSWFFCCANWAIREESSTYAERGESGGVFLISRRAVGQSERQEGEVVVHHRDVQQAIAVAVHFVDVGSLLDQKLAEDLFPARSALRQREQQRRNVLRGQVLLPEQIFENVRVGSQQRVHRTRGNPLDFSVEKIRTAVLEVFENRRGGQHARAVNRSQSTEGQLQMMKANERDRVHGLADRAAHAQQRVNHRFRIAFHAFRLQNRVVQRRQTAGAHRRAHFVRC